MRVFVIGPSGCGKSTQAKRLAKLLSVSYVYVGEELRKVSREPSELGRRIKKIIDAGGFVRDKDDIEQVFQRIFSSDSFVVDGTPRTLQQMELLDARYPPDYVIYIKVPDSVVVSRLLRRGRKDDTEPVIRNRMKNFYADGRKIAAHYRKLGILHEVDGNRPKASVWKDIRKIFK